MANKYHLVQLATEAQSEGKLEQFLNSLSRTDLLTLKRQQTQLLVDASRQAAASIKDDLAVGRCLYCRGER